MSNVCPKSGIWSKHIARKRHHTDKFLAAAIGTYYEPSGLMADLGCGLGHYCKILYAYGWTCVGFEGTKDIKDIAKWQPIIEIDLSVPVEIEAFEKKYDFVLCLEVGEHIPRKREQTFIDNICFFANDNIVMSWAVPGQYSASGHVNCRPNDYVINELAKRRFILDNDMTAKLRKAATFNWFKNTIMVFKNG